MAKVSFEKGFARTHAACLLDGQFPEETPF